MQAKVWVEAQKMLYWALYWVVMPKKRDHVVQGDAERRMAQSPSWWCCFGMALVLVFRLVLGYDD